jgi:hypothetical protein
MSLLILFDTEGEAPPPILTTVGIVDINVYSKVLVHVEFNDEVIVNDLYNDPSNYSISVVEGEGPVEVVGILHNNKSSSLDVILITQPMTFGTTYSVAVTELSARDGTPQSFTGSYVSRNTKTDSLLRSIPKHFDKRPTSLLSALLLAMGISDDIIGGSRNDSITYS